MNLRDYLSNSAVTKRTFVESDRAKSTQIKVLGIQWNAIEDTITLECSKKAVSNFSKRTVLSQINGYCYDPLGLLSPLMTPAKIFLQDLHKQKYGWDELLSEEDQNTWNSITANIVGFQVSLPRKVVERMEGQSTQCIKETKLFTAKSKIAPIKKEQTIPRLELLSIFIGLSLAEFTINKIDVNFEQINLFSDSTIALCWVQGHKRLPSVATTLVQKIGLITKRVREVSNIAFYHVPTHENIADCATRGVIKSDFIRHRWWSGPVWLNMHVESWPVNVATNLSEQSSDDEIEVYTAVEQAKQPVWSLEKTNDYSKLTRITAYCARFIRNATKGRRLPLQCSALETIHRRQKKLSSRSNFLSVKNKSFTIPRYSCRINNWMSEWTTKECSESTVGSKTQILVSIRPIRFIYQSRANWDI
uniref:RNase H domain-containing protein n=1 Tax=Haemonchus contortus TaxID=6289 RepID=A0A7I4Z4E9_HAECO